MRGCIVVLLSLVLNGCITSVPLKPVTYDREAQVSSNKIASIELQTGIVGGSGSSTLMMVSPGVFIPISTGPIPHLQFNEQDQLVFIESLKSEINRLGILNTAKSKSSNEKEEEVKILILFAQTHHNPNHQEYTLDVGLQIEGGGKSFANKYRVISSDGDSWWTKMNTNASEGKAKAGKKLLLKVIPDIESWVKNNG